MSKVSESIIEVELVKESQSRYLTYALSVVNSRALPDIRDGLKPVQRRILYAMYNNLNLGPEKHHRKSAAVVGEVLARFHPHGDSACYEAMVRMAQSFSLRYPLIDGQGNFGSLDGDSAAAYRYTEARLTEFALEVLGEIEEETVEFRDNFDQTTKEPVVLPSRVPNLIINGASGIAVGMATSIPPHNLTEVLKGLLLLLESSEVPDSKLYSVIKAPDFPTGCEILNSKEELKEIYRTGRGPVKMQASYFVEELKETKASKKKPPQIIITSVPYGIDKSQAVSQIADLIISKKLPLLVDVRDESTTEVRVVLEPSASFDPTVSKELEKVMAFIFKNTILRQNFNVNLTALIPTENPYSGRPEHVSLRMMLEEFIKFRTLVTRRKLEFEKKQLEARVHLLEGLASIYDALDEVIKIVRKSDGRANSAENLIKRFQLSEIQAYFIVDLRIYQLSRTSIEEIRKELAEKTSRIAQIAKLLSNENLLKKEISIDFERILEKFGDKRRSKINSDFTEVEFSTEEFLEHEDVYIIVTKDGWIKRLRKNNDPKQTRLREGDSIFFLGEASTKDTLSIITNLGNIYISKIHNFSASSGFGEPVQKIYKFSDGEQIVSCVSSSVVTLPNSEPSQEFAFITSQGLGFRSSFDLSQETKKNGKRLVKLNGEDLLVDAQKIRADKKLIFISTKKSLGLLIKKEELPELNLGAKGVNLMKVSTDDAVVGLLSLNSKDKVEIITEAKQIKELNVGTLDVSKRGLKGNKIFSKAISIFAIKEPSLTEG